MRCIRRFIDTRHNTHVLVFLLRVFFFIVPVTLVSRLILVFILMR
jgi:hypothetical protein